MDRLIYRTRGGKSRVKSPSRNSWAVPGLAMRVNKASAAVSMITPAITMALSVQGSSSAYHSQAARGETPWLPRGPMGAV